MKIAEKDGVVGKGLQLEFYEGDFGRIRVTGLIACMGNHLKTKTWRYVPSPDLDGARAKAFVCSVYCQACKIEKHLNDLAKAIWITGGILTGLTIDPPAPGTSHQPMTRMKRDKTPEPPGW